MRSGVRRYSGYQWVCEKCGREGTAWLAELGGELQSPDAKQLAEDGWAKHRLVCQ